MLLRKGKGTLNNPFSSVTAVKFKSPFGIFSGWLTGDSGQKYWNIFTPSVPHMQDETEGNP